MIHGLSEQLIKTNASAESFRRGQSYFRSGSVSSVVQREGNINAKVAGSDYEPYRVRIKTGNKGIVSVRCSCPYDWGGWCKHIVATLLAYMAKPEAVRTESTLQSRLQALGSEQLISLVLRMVERHDDLEILIDVATAGKSDHQDLDALRLKIQKIFSQIEHKPYESNQLDSGLEEVLEIGDVYASQGSFRLATDLYVVFLDVLMEWVDSIYDYNGDLLSLADACVEKLEFCLENIDEPGVRKQIFRTLMDAFLKDIDMGGVGFADAASEIMKNLSNDDEKVVIGKWLNEKLESYYGHKTDYSGSWSKREIGGFLLDLEQDTLGDNEYLQRCRDSTRWEDLISRLIELDRIDEAMEEVQHMQGYEFQRMLNVFDQYNLENKIASLVRERIKAKYDYQLAEWLMKYAEHSGNEEEALAICERFFWQRRDLEKYKEFKRLALKCEIWEQQWRNIENRLVDENAFDLLTEIYVFEEKFKLAFTSLRKVLDSRRENNYWGTHRLPLLVASTVKTSYPEEAIRIYGQVVEELVGLRGRGNYAGAARHLRTIQGLYLSLNRPGDWTQVIDEMKTIYIRLPAFLDELKKAGL